MCDKSTILTKKSVGESGASIKPFSLVWNDNCKKLSNSNMDVHLVKSLKHNCSNSVEQVVLAKTCVTTNIISSSVSFFVWHQRLDHPSSQILKHVIPSWIICSDRIEKSQLCIACNIGKSHKLPISLAEGVYTAPLQLIQVDIWGLASIISSGSKYYISYVDAYSRFTWLYFLANKSDGVSVINSFQMSAEKN